MKKTFAQLKRDLKVGKKLKLIYNIGCCQTYVGSTREISKVQTNLFCLKTLVEKEYENSYVWYPEKASLVEYEDNRFRFYCYAKWANNERILKLEFEFVD